MNLTDEHTIQDPVDEFEVVKKRLWVYVVLLCVCLGGVYSSPYFYEKHFISQVGYQPHEKPYFQKAYRKVVSPLGYGSVPHIFATGDTISAKEMNAEFQYIYDQINELEISKGVTGGGAVHSASKSKHER